MEAVWTKIIALLSEMCQAETTALLGALMGCLAAKPLHYSLS